MGATPISVISLQISGLEGFLMLRTFVKVLLWTSSICYLGALLVLRQLHRRPRPRKAIHIFHVAADAGGGGEKCLWAIIQGLSVSCNAPTQVNIYTHQDVQHVQTVLRKVQQTFGTELRAQGGDRQNTHLSSCLRLSLIRLRSAQLLAYRWPLCQHLGELITGVLVGTEAAFCSTGSFKDSIWDTQGLPAAVCTYNLLTSLCARPMYCYVHWPWVNAQTFVEYKELQLSVRSLYHLVLSQLYRALGSFYWKPVCVNSTYTEARLKKAWGLNKPNDLVKVLPPVDKHLQVHAAGAKRELVLSIAQFRPEKNHAQQIRAIARLLHKYDVKLNTRFCICGSLSNGADKTLADYLYELAKECCGHKCSVTYFDHDTNEMRGMSEVKQNWPLLEFHLNIEEDELARLKSIAKVGLHTMKEEHFGIAVVDLLLAGALVVAHRSGGPLLDILRPPSTEEAMAAGISPTDLELGLFAESDDEFADKLHEALEMSTQSVQRLQSAQLIAKHRFLDTAEFGSKLLETWNPPRLTDKKRS